MPTPGDSNGILLLRLMVVFNEGFFGEKCCDLRGDKHNVLRTPWGNSIRGGNRFIVGAQRDDRCAVTGAGGFIGSHLCEALLADGWRVRALVHYNALGRRGFLEQIEPSDRLEIVAGDVCDPRCLRELVRGCRCVMHLAALIGIPYSYLAPSAYVQTNVVGTLSLLEACRDEGVGRVIVTSTSEVYGSARTVPIDEAHPLQAQSPYAATKIAADKLAESYRRSFGLPVVVARPFNTFGPRQSARAVIPTAIMQAMDPGRAEVRLGSTGPVRDWVYVTDTAAGFVALADAPERALDGEPYNIATGEGHSVLEMAEREIGRAHV